ncbi:hypothetical protein Ate01nite_13850 [Actinoplanes teichomyceticus]|nr:hypothetical protein Ate01nite_13850 [Actinoplanes teichomyceticus]
METTSPESASAGAAAPTASAAVPVSTATVAAPILLFRMVSPVGETRARVEIRARRYLPKRREWIMRKDEPPAHRRDLAVPGPAPRATTGSVAESVDQGGEFSGQAGQVVRGLLGGPRAAGAPLRWPGAVSDRVTGTAAGRGRRS